jgi:hypothetical protein
LGKTYCPAELVVAVLVSLVAVFVRVTAASGTTAPAASVTVPKTRAESEVCARDGAADSNTTTNTKPIANFAENFILPPTTESVDEQGLNSGENEPRRQESGQRHEHR